MKISEYLKLLAGVWCFLLICLTSLHCFPIFVPYISLSGFGVVLFTLLSLIMYYLGEFAIRSENKYLFIQLIVFNFIFKLIVSVAALLIYRKIANPEDTNYLIPFILIYLSFTVFETIFMSKQAHFDSKKI